MATSSALLRKRAPADRAKKLGATRLTEPQARRPFADVSNGACDNARLVHDASPSRLPPCMSVPPPASPVAQHLSFVGDTETFLEPHAQLRLQRRTLAADHKESPAASWNLSGVLATLHSKAALLLAEETTSDAPERDGVLGSGLQAMNRVATVVGTALDSFVEGGLDSLGMTHVSAAVLTPDPRAAARHAPCEMSLAPQSTQDAEPLSGTRNGAATAPPDAFAASWGGFEETPFSPPRPACRRAAHVRSPEPLLVGPLAAAAPREAEDLAEQVRAQLQLLLVEKARLAQENARLERENRNLQELLSVVTSSAAQDDAPLDDDSEPLVAAGLHAEM